MRILRDDPHDEHSELVLQSDTLFVGDARREAFQAAVHIENYLIVLDVRLQVIYARHRLHIVRIDVDEQWPDLASQIVIHQTVVAQRERCPSVQSGFPFVRQGCFDLFAFYRLFSVFRNWNEGR